MYATFYLRHILNFQIFVQVRSSNFRFYTLSSPFQPTMAILVSLGKSVGMQRSSGDCLFSFFTEDLMSIYQAAVTYSSIQLSLFVVLHNL